MRSKELVSQMQIWAGFECTINRIGDEFFDQSSYAGYEIREEDISQFAQLGISKIRYPILWEKYQVDKGKPIDWGPVEAHLGILEKYEIEPIAGLLHHGSGPAFTNLLDPLFPEKFAEYALQVASRFPQLRYYTPINEPLTTARFSGLYGLWYPHLRDDQSFLKILLNECKASLLAMQAIRTVNPEAIWVQTEDLGKTHSTPALQYQADFENRRRWLGFDLMMGKVISQHPLWEYLSSSGIDQEELKWLELNCCLPDIIGLNYYATSERYLDERIENYPENVRGSNRRDNYADVEAVRSRPEGLSGLKVLLKEAWMHIGQAMAITEVHLHCTRDEQLRWFHEIWQDLEALKNEGLKIVAFTAWALWGSYGWNKLLTEGKGDYEPGIFDLSNGKPRPTALCRLIRSLSEGKLFHHPALDRPGWWRRISNEYFLQNSLTTKNIQTQTSFKPLLIIGKNGTLGRAFAHICNQRALDHYLLGRTELDITQKVEIEKIIRQYKPWAIINTAGYVKVDDAEQEELTCFNSNTRGAENLAQICRKYGIPLVTFSSDLVFDGQKTSPYLECDRVAPLNIYGRSKALAEKRILATYPEALVIRTSAFFGPWDESNFAHQVLRLLNLRQPVYAAHDITISPTYVPEMVNTCLDLLLDEEKGFWHLANHGALSWADFAREIAGRAGYCIKQIISLPAGELGFKAQRPQYSVLRSGRGANLSALDRALDHFFSQKKNKY